MRYYIVVATLLIAITPSSSGRIALASTSPEQSCTTIEDALRSYGKLKTGMTRADLQTDFVQDGGLSFRGEGLYVYRKCAFIKIKVSFETDSNTRTAFSAKDTIRSISQLYINYPSKD